jgi:hypothetical protein
MVQREQPEPQAQLVQQERLVQREQPEPQAQLVQQERLVLKVQQVLQLLGTTDRFMTQPHK